MNLTLKEAARKYAFSYQNLRTLIAKKHVRGIKKKIDGTNAPVWLVNSDDLDKIANTMKSEAFDRERQAEYKAKKLYFECLEKELKTQKMKLQIQAELREELEATVRDLFGDLNGLGQLMKLTKEQKILWRDHFTGIARRIKERAQ